MKGVVNVKIRRSYAIVVDVSQCTANAIADWISAVDTATSFGGCPFSFISVLLLVLDIVRCQETTATEGCLDVASLGILAWRDEPSQKNQPR